MAGARDLRIESRDIRMNKDGTYVIRVENPYNNRTEYIHTADLETGIRVYRNTYDLEDGGKRIQAYETQVEILTEVREFPLMKRGKPVLDRNGNEVTFKKKIFTGYNIIHGGFDGQTTIQRKHVLYKPGGDRLDNGFQTLLAQLRWGGIDTVKLEHLEAMWDFLSDKQKAIVYARYRTSSVVLAYGSNAISESERDFGDAETYYNTMYNIIQKVIVGL